MQTYIKLAVLAALALPTVAFAANKAPSADEARQAIETRLMGAKMPDATERNILFQDLQPGTANGDSYPYQVAFIVRDYGPGFPANHYYGQTCVGRVARPGWRFVVRQDDFGTWQAAGRTTLQTSEGLLCKPNPSEGVSSMPLADLQ